MTTSLGKLQATVDKQAKQILKLQERIEDLTIERNEYKRKYETLKVKYDDLNAHIEEIVEARINEAVDFRLLYFYANGFLTISVLSYIILKSV